MMNVNHSERTPAQIEGIIELAQLLERIEHNPVAVNADQYQRTVERLSDALRDAPSDAFLDKLLTSFPATAELYENLHYQRSGLSRTPLELSTSTEMNARELLARMARAD